jgi:hypothetical protein
MSKKAQGISINMIVIIALAVFTIFLIMGFATGGWSYFTGAFKGATGGSGGYDTAKIRCDQFCNSLKNSGCIEGSAADKRVTDHMPFGYDTNEDGDGSNDYFRCEGSCDSRGGECVGKVIGTCCKRNAAGGSSGSPTNNNNNNNGDQPDRS